MTTVHKCKEINIYLYFEGKKVVFPCFFQK
nr:MAG TPA: hypothetical protein [Caudoviricetes sp.]